MVIGNHKISVRWFIIANRSRITMRLDRKVVSLFKVYQACLSPLVSRLLTDNPHHMNWNRSPDFMIPNLIFHKVQ